MEEEINGLDIVGVQAAIDRRKGRYISLLLTDLESVLSEEDYKVARKLILDNFNDFCRSVFRILFGEVEGLTFR